MTTPGRRIRTLIAVLSAAALAAGCSGGIGPNRDNDASGPAEGPSGGGTITYAYPLEFQAYNNNTAVTSQSRNRIVLNGVLRGFWDFGPRGEILPNPEFGTVEKVSDDPLQVRYTFAEEATWSDGEPIDCDDFLLAWAAGSGYHTTGEKNSDGSPQTVFDPPRPQGFELQEKPSCKAGEKTVTVTYTEPYGYWDALYGTEQILPAHIVEQETGVDLIAAIADDDIPALTKAAEFYNEAWVFEPGELPTELMPSSGPYVIDSWDAGQSLTLKANDAYWGTAAANDAVVIRYIDQRQQVAALENDEAQVALPAASADLMGQLERLDSLVNVQPGATLTWYYLLFNHQGAFAELKTRQAFAACLPRQLIVDNLIKPTQPDAEVLNSRFVAPFQDGYAEYVQQIGAPPADEVDIEAARTLLEEAGQVGMKVRVGYQVPNPNHADTVNLIRDSCGQAGFEIVDDGSDDYNTVRSNEGNFDVALTGWGLPSGSPGSSDHYSTDGSGNRSGYGNKDVDRLMIEYNSAMTPEARREVAAEIETILWRDLVTIPLYNAPGVLVWSKELEGPELNSTSSGDTWNMAEWHWADAS